MILRLIGLLGISPFRFWMYVAMAISFMAFCGTIYLKGYMNCSGDQKITKANGIIAGKKADDKLEKEINTIGHDALVKRASRWVYD